MSQHVDERLIPLRAELERLGYVVVPHGRELCVRLPLLCSVRIAADGDRVRLTPKFGPLGRTGGLLFSSVLATGVVSAAAIVAGAPAAIVAAFLGILALAHDACRFVVTEGCLTRLQNLLVPMRIGETSQVALQREMDADSARTALPDGSTAMRGEVVLRPTPRSAPRLS